MHNCAICHGENGNGQTDLARDMQLPVSDWTAPKALANKPDGNLFTLIRNGKDKMPPEAEDRARDEEVRGLILYIRGFSKSQPATSSGSQP
jgi:mono/diheme cytochrome c family protein